MENYKKTLILAAVLIIYVVIAMFAFSAIEDKLAYDESLSLCFQIFSTIGYGDPTPQTHDGQLFAIIFALSAIPLNFWLLKLIGEHILDGEKLAISKLEYKIFKRYPRFLPEKCVLVGVVFVWSLVLIPAAILKYHSNLSLVRGVYCYVFNFTTVGYADLIPYYYYDYFDDPPKVVTSLKIFKVFYSYFGLCIMSSILNGAFEAQELFECLRKRFGHHGDHGMQGAEMINEESGDVAGIVESNQGDPNQVSCLALSHAL